MRPRKRLVADALVGSIWLGWDAIVSREGGVGVSQRRLQRSRTTCRAS
jgi:hypothetical protein